MIYFSTREKLVKEYYDWLKENPTVEDCAFNLISFLESKYYLDDLYIKKTHPPYNYYLETLDKEEIICMQK